MTSFADPGSGAQGSESRDVEVRLGADVSGYSQSVGAAAQQTALLTGQVDKASASMGSLAKFAGKQLIHFSVADFAGLSAGVADAASLEKQMGTLRATSVVTGSSMGELSKQLDAAFTSFPVARAQVIQLAETISSLGVTAPKSIGSMVGTFEKLGAATGQDPNQLAGSSLQLDRMLGNTTPDAVAGYANSLLTVSKNQGVAASSVNDFAQNIAPMARAAGIGEAAILGISAAFAKAGADGGLAANAFSQITGDITNLSQTGDPQISKYSSYVGKTATQFRAESGTQQVTSVFDQIAKGGPQANAFLQSLGISARSVKSIQAVAQGGGLNAAVAQAQGSTGNTDNLDAASATAFKGLASDVADVGNQFTKLGEQIGDPLLKPIELVVKGFDKILGFVNTVVSALGPLPGYAAAIVGALAIPAGLALGHLGLVGGLAGAKVLLGRNSGPRTAAREGTAAGELIRGGMAPEQAMLMSATGRRIADGEDPNTKTPRASARLRVPYNVARDRAVDGLGPTVLTTANRAAGRIRDVATRGARFGADRLGIDETGGAHRADPGVGYAAPVAGGRHRAPVTEGSFSGRVQAVGAAGDAAFTRAAGMSVKAAASEFGSSVKTAAATAGQALRNAPGGIFRGAAGLSSYFMNQQTNMNLDSTRRNYQGRSFYQNDTGQPGFRAANQVPGFMSTMRSGSVRNVATSARNLVSSTTKAAGSMFASGVGSAVRAGEPGLLRRGVANVGTVAARAGGAAFTGVSKLAGAAFSPLGFLATSIGIPLISSIVSSIKESSAAPANIDHSLGGAAKYDQALDKTSTNLSKFGDALAEQASKLGKYANVPLAGLGNVTAEDRAATSSKDYKLSDANLADVVNRAKAQAAAPGGSPDTLKNAVLQYLKGVGIQAGDITGDNITKYKQDVNYAVGPGNEAQVSDIMNTFIKQVQAPGGLVPGANFTSVGSLAATADTGSGDRYLKNFQDIYGGGVDAINAATQNSGPAGIKSAMAQNLALAGAGVGEADKGQGEREKAIYAFLQKSNGNLDPDALAAQVTKDSIKNKTATTIKLPGTNTDYMAGESPGGNGSADFANSADATTGIARAYTELPAGQAWLKANGMTADQFVTAAQNPGAQPALTDSQAVTDLNTHGGALGASVAKDKDFLLASTGTSSGDPGKSFAESQKLVTTAAAQSGGDLTKASAALAKLSDVMGATGQPTGVLIKAAEDWATQLQTYKTATLSVEGQLMQGHSAATIDIAAANVPGASADTVAKGKASQLADMAGQESYRQSMISKIVALNQFTVQQDRAVAANNLSVTNTNRDFQEQQQHSLQDFNTQKDRTEKAFNLSQTRSIEDNNTQKLRSQEQFQLQSQRSLEDYQLQVSRQNTAHALQLARQAQQDAQSIYDPFAQIETKATTDAGTLIYNLQEQNGSIEKQKSQLAVLKQQGLSQQSIDTLNLSATSNDQEVATLVQSFQQNPNMAKQINSLNAKRLGDTQSLTQDPTSMTFRNSEADYKLQQSQASDDFTKAQQRAAHDYGISTNQMAEDFKKQQDRAAADQKTATDNTATDFALSSSRAVFDHQKALDDMSKAFKLMQDQAAQDLATSFKQYTGNFGQIFDQLATTALGALKNYAPAASKIITDAQTAIQASFSSLIITPLNLNPKQTGPGSANAAEFGGVTYPTQVTGSSNSAENGGIAHPAFGSSNAAENGASSQPAAAAPVASYVPPPPKGKTPYAFGGISLTQQNAVVSEFGPELHLPLNSRGQDFMAGIIAKSLAQGVIQARTATPAVATSMSHDNSISFAGAEIQVVAQDPNKMAQALTAKAKLARLASPVRH